MQSSSPESSAASQVSLPSSSQIKNGILHPHELIIVQRGLKHEGRTPHASESLIHPTDKSPCPTTTPLILLSKCPKKQFLAVLTPSPSFSSLTHAPCNLGGLTLSGLWFQLWLPTSLPRLTTTTLRRCVGMAQDQGL